MAKKTRANAKKAPSMITSEGALIPAIVAIDEFLARLDNSRRTAGETQPRAAYFSSEERLYECLTRWFSGLSVDDWKSVIQVIEFRTGEAIPWNEEGAFRYVLAHRTPNLTEYGRLFAQGIGVTLPDGENPTDKRKRGRPAKIDKSKDRRIWEARQERLPYSEICHELNISHEEALKGNDRYRHTPRAKRARKK